MGVGEELRQITIDAYIESYNKDPKNLKKLPLDWAGLHTGDEGYNEFNAFQHSYASK